MERPNGYNILDLPPCVLLHIYSFLNPEDILSMRNICQHWHHVSYNGSLWKTLDTRRCGDTFVTDGSFCALLHEVENIIECLHFDIRFIAILQYLIERDNVFCPNLKKMYIYNDTQLGMERDINRTFGLDEKMVKLSRKYKQLKTLGYDDLFINTDAVFSDLEEFECNCTCITVDTSLEEPTQLMKFLKRHTHLRDIHIQLLSCNSEDVFSSLFTDFPRLKKLSICGILSGDLSPQLQHKYHLAQLQSLHINSLDYITDETLEVILKNTSDLRKFEVWYCNLVTDITLECLAKYCHKLETFGMLSHERNYTEAGLITVATNCPELREVKISQFLDSQDLTISSFIVHCPELRVLEVGGAPNLTDSTILIMVERCPNIRRLDFSRCQNLTALSISAVLRCYKHLDFLNIADNKTLTSFDLVEAKLEEEAKIRNSEKTEEDNCMNGNTSEEQTIVNKKMESKYEATNMNENASKKRPRVQDEAEFKDEQGEEINGSDRNRKYEGNITKIRNVKTLTRSVERWSALKTLDMSGCSAVTDSCLFNIACFCSNLRKINISRCENVTDTTVQEFVKRCHFLKMLDISVAEDTDINERERRITDDSLVEIARYCKYLETLNVEHRDYITAQGVSEVLNTCQAIQSVRLTVNSEKPGITNDQLIDIAERCKHKFVGIFEPFVGFTYSSIEIELFNFKPSFSKEWLCCNYDA